MPGLSRTAKLPKFFLRPDGVGGGGGVPPAGGGPRDLSPLYKKSLELLERFLDLSWRCVEPLTSFPYFGNYEKVLVWEVFKIMGEKLSPMVERQIKEVKSPKDACIMVRAGMPNFNSIPSLACIKEAAGVPIEDRNRIIETIGKFSNEELAALLSTGIKDWIPLSPHNKGVQAMEVDQALEENIQSKVIAFFLYRGKLDKLIKNPDQYHNSRIEMAVKIAEVYGKLHDWEKAFEIVSDILAKSDPSDCSFYSMGKGYMSHLVYAVKFIQSLSIRVVTERLLEEEGLALLLKKYRTDDQPKEKDGVIVNAGFAYPKEAVDRMVASADPLTASLLKLGKTLFEISQEMEEAEPEKFAAWWKGVKKLSPEIKNRTIESLKGRTFSGKLGDVVEVLIQTGDIGRDPVLKRQLIKRLEAARIINPELEKRLEQDPGYLELISPVIKLSHKMEKVLQIAHLFKNEQEICDFESYLKLDPFELLRRFDLEPNAVKQAYLLFILGVKMRDNFEMQSEIFNRSAKLLGDKGLAPEYKKILEKIYQNACKVRFLEFVGPEGSYDQVPAKVAELGRELAGVAHKVLEKVREVAKTSRKPTINIYVLTTGHAFNGERILDGFYKNPAARQKILARIQKTDSHYARRVAGLSSLKDDERINEEMRIIHQAFYDYVDRLQLAESMDRLTAIMTVGGLWVERGYLEYFTYPLEIKIPSNPLNPMPPDTRLQLEELARKAGKGGWDIILVDHSTLRTADVVHAGDSPEWNKGRAIARGMEIIQKAVGSAVNRVWIYKENDWKIVDPLKREQVNLIGLNLYNGKVYDQHVWGRKEEWLKIDDHGKTMMGFEVKANGMKQLQTMNLVEKAEDGDYHSYSIPKLYWGAFRLELARIEDWPATLPSFKYSNIVFVCSANHHRSPTFEILLKKMMRERLGPDAEKVAVSSAGLEAESFLARHSEKQGMSPRARKMLLERGMHVNGFEKTQLSEEQVMASDLILVMTKREKEALLKKFPKTGAKVKLVKEFLGYPEPEQEIATPKEFSAQVFSEFEKLALAILDKIYI